MVLSYSENVCFSNRSVVIINKVQNCSELKSKASESKLSWKPFEFLKKSSESKN